MLKSLLLEPPIKFLQLGRTSTPEPHMPLDHRNVLPPGRSPCRVASKIPSRCPDLRPDILNGPRACRRHIIWHETEQPQRPDLQTANQTSPRADTIPHQLKITVTQRETADQILGGYLHRETVQHRTIAITQEAATSHNITPKRNLAHTNHNHTSITHRDILATQRRTRP